MVVARLACDRGGMAAPIWDRALLTAREQGEAVPPEWTDAALDTLASIRSTDSLLEPG